MAVIAMGMLAYAVIGMWQAYQVFGGQYWLHAEETWVTTDGTIETAYRRSALDRRASYETGWTYSYSVSGDRFEAKSTAIRYAYRARMDSTEQNAKAEAELRPVGSNVTVYYDPAAPQHSVLDLATDSAWNWVPLLFSLMSFGLVFLSARALVKARWSSLTRLTDGDGNMAG